MLTAPSFPTGTEWGEKMIAPSLGIGKSSEPKFMDVEMGLLEE
jgi:hypothetical protein